ncbi:uncharacterized protein MELLADRAFT_69144 [Melampsora larici-populina 98AG31]|uniref:Uncharacterized protein n=1 Tax=Melampsora larici-populina (strain 98AG31 / pathotype 3-4-7) TaxID=747676 RepID=F4S9J9_MELLP|nr:uncharacterized protein MELLADRAFT_69144 [Melampsora larici-populina 98AG31]EGF98651.1 hypothetical protein MELLADRAFT_69144 [Melampsora larici-populina 98AG31]
MSYSELLKHVQSIQRVYDELPSTSNGVQKQHLPSLILDIWYADATILDVESGKNLVDSEVESWLEALETKRIVLDQLEKISIEFDLEIPLVDYLPAPGSEDWLRLFEAAHRMIDDSKVIQTQSNSPEDEKRG